VTLHFVPNEGGEARVGVTVSRKVGGSVVRHRIKRRILEAYRQWPERRALPAWDFVVHVKPGAAEAGFAALRAELLRLFQGASEGRR
jgi:ribonuclease P protein component